MSLSKNILDIGAFVVSIAALALSAFTYYQSVQIQKKATAYSFWQNYLALTVEEPALAQGIWDKRDSTHRYEWFVANTLGTCEIVYSFQPDKHWTYTVKEVMANHREYLGSDSFKDSLKDYDPEFRAIIDQVIEGK